jgi:hypothetical protein
MDDKYIKDKDDELMKNIDKMADKINELHQNGKITDCEYRELMELDFDEQTNDDSIKAFKKCFKVRKPIKCSELLLKIYDEHKSNFRKAIMLSDCFPDPLSYKYTNEVHEFCMSVLNRTYRLVKRNNYPNELLKELGQVYFALKAFHHNYANNTSKLEQSDFFKYSLSEQIRMFCIYLQDQSRLDVVFHTECEITCPKNLT